MDLTPGSLLLRPDGELVCIGHTLTDGESFADHATAIRRVMRPDDEIHARLSRARYAGNGGSLSDLAEALVSSATDTPLPTNTPVSADAKADANVQLSSNQPGVLVVTWDAPSQTPGDYRIDWAKAGEDVPLIRDGVGGTALLGSPPYSISGLEGGVTYKVRLRSRYSGETNGAWTGVYTAVVAS